MTSLNLIKLCVGIEDIDHLARVQKARLAAQREAAQDQETGAAPKLRHITRMWPRRESELLGGGSLYWVIKGAIRCRQQILGLEDAVNGQGKPACGIILDPEIVLTERRAFRAFQGWRYLKGEDTPSDLGEMAPGAVELPDDMAAELRELGLL